MKLTAAWSLVTTILHLSMVALVQLIENVTKWGLIFDHVHNSVVFKSAILFFLYGTKYSRIDEVMFVEDSL